MFDDDPSIWNQNGPGPRLASGSRAGILANTLAWAARHGIAFDVAFSTLTDGGLLRLGTHGAKWHRRVQLATRDLRNGVPLHRALRQRLACFLPEHFLLAVEEAENAGRLAEVLPCFAQRLELVTDRQLGVKAGLLYPAVVLMNVLLLFLGLCTFILPKFAAITRELSAECPEASLPWTYDIILAISRLVGDSNLWLLLSVAGGLLLVFRRPLWDAVERPFLSVPIVGRAIEQEVMLELAGGMGAFLASGEDVARAGEFCQKATRRPWLKKRLTRFTAEVRAGKPWVDAWDGLGVGTPLHTWMIRNAAAREAPVEGFDCLLGWLVQEFSQTSQFLVRLAEISGVVVNGLLVALVATTIFGFLTRLVHVLAAW